MKSRIAVLATAVLALGVCQSSLAADDLTTTIGVRLWSNKWSSWDAQPSVPAAGVQSSVENYTSNGKAAFLPAVSVRYKDFSFSGSMMTNTSYGFNFAGGTGSAERKEYDLAVGYFLLPSVSVNLGYKSVTQKFSGTPDKYEYQGPFVGVSASAPLGNQWAVYGSVAVGRLDAEFPAFVAAPALLSSRNNTADYRLSEVGIAYAFGPVFAGAKNVALTIGYRAQVLDTGLTLPQGGFTATSLVSRSTRGRDNTEGLTIGLSASF